MLVAACAGGPIYRGSAYAQAGLTLPGPMAPCASFSRDDSGGWTVLYPVRFSVAGVPADFPRGTRFDPGSPARGMPVAAIRDTGCGASVPPLYRSEG